MTQPEEPEVFLTTTPGPVYSAQLDENGELEWTVRPPDGLTWEAYRERYPDIGRGDE